MGKRLYLDFNIRDRAFLSLRRDKFLKEWFIS